MNLSNEAKSPTLLLIRPGLAYGEITSSGTRGPSWLPATVGGGTWSYQPPKSSQVTKIAVDDQAGLFMMAFTMEATQFCAGWVGCGGWSESASEPGVT